MPVVAVIADLVESRAIEERADFQRRLKGRLAEISAASGGRLLSPWTLTLGDEFQALYGGFAGLFADLFALFDACRPVALRVAIGAGELTTDLNPRAALEMDGPAFHRARAAMETLKPRARAGLLVDAGPEQPLELANAALALLAGETRTWKASTLGIFRDLLRGTAPEDIAEAAGLGLRAVYKNSAGRLLPERRRLLLALEEDLDGRVFGGRRP